MIRKDCNSCSSISELLVNSSTLIFAKENNSRVMCDNNHIIYNPMEEV